MKIFSDIRETIVNLMKLYGVDLVEVPEHIISMLHHRNYAVQKITPKFVLKYLKSDPKYKKMKDEQKLQILRFLLSGKKSSKPTGLELLPLQNGAFTTFGKRGRDKQIIVCRDEWKLFPGQEDMFCRQDIHTEVYEALLEMAESGNVKIIIIFKY